MIRVTRIAKPEILSKKEVIWTKELQNALAEFRKNKIPKNRKKLNSAFNKYKHKQIKDSLRMMFVGKCAYCESHISHVGYGHIEHYQPKSKFPERCFDWDNLLLGCEICNGKRYKGDKFPDSHENGPFVNPVTENPDDFFDFEFDPNTGTANVIPKNNRALTTEKELGLNRPELLIHRSSVVRKMVFAALKAKDGDQDGIKEIRKCCRQEDEYAAFARALVKRFNI